MTSTHYYTAAMLCFFRFAHSSSSPYYSPKQVMVDVTNDLGVCVLQIVASRRENIAFSPYGLVSVALVLYEGSDGPTASEIHYAVRLPWDRDLTRIGFRDLHRYLKSYFTNEGFLRGIFLSKPDVTLRHNYTKLLKFYGFQTPLVPENRETSPTSPPKTTMMTTVTTPTEMTSTATMTSTTKPTTLSEEPRTTVTSERTSIETTPISTMTPGPATSGTEPMTSNAKPSTATEQPTATESTTRPPTTVSEQTTKMTTSRESDTTIIEVTVKETTMNQSVTVSNPATTMATMTTLSAQTTTARPETTSSSPKTTTSVPTTETTSVQSTEAVTPTTIPDTKATMTSPMPEAESTESTTSDEPNTSLAPETTTMESEMKEAEQTLPMDISTEASSSMDTQTASTMDVTSTTQVPTTVVTTSKIVRNARSLPSSLYPMEHRSVPNWIPTKFYPYEPRPSTDALWFFTFSGGETVPVLTYSAYLPFAHVPELRSLALQLPLDDPRYSMLVILPEDRFGMGDALHSLQWVSIRDILRQLRVTAIYAVVPSFTVVKQIDLRLPLGQLGVRKLFDPYRADLTLMSSEPNLFVRTIEQVVTVSLRKYHFEQWLDAAPIDIEHHFIANHPFIYFVFDRETEVTLMVGTIVNPTAHEQ